MGVTTIEPLEAYLERMTEWAQRAIMRFQKKGHVVFDHNDLFQEAQLALIKTHEKYAGKKSGAELGRLGTQAVVNHMLNLYEKHMTKKRHALLVPLIDELAPGDTIVETVYDTDPILDHVTPLDSVLAREAIDAMLAVSQDAREIVSAALDGDRRPERPKLAREARDLIFSVL